MKYQLIQCIAGRMVASDFTEDNVAAGMEVHGFYFNGQNSNPLQRAELQNQPRFSGLCGPMWGGEGVIRYEDQTTHDRLSA